VDTTKKLGQGVDKNGGYGNWEGPSKRKQSGGSGASGEEKEKMSMMGQGKESIREKKIGRVKQRPSRQQTSRLDRTYPENRGRRGGPGGGTISMKLRGRPKDQKNRKKISLL